MAAIETRDKYRLPPRLFLYTLDQIEDMLQLPQLKNMLHYRGRTTGVPRKDFLLCVNIMPQGKRPEWRVPEDEFIRWMRHTGVLPYRSSRYKSSMQ